jgi:hypothetical protein
MIVLEEFFELTLKLTDCGKVRVKIRKFEGTGLGNIGSHGRER